MSRKLYALLVGIDQYQGDIDSLNGCVNDMKNVNEYLKNYFIHYNLKIETLKNNKATRSNIIQSFRNHLCNAGKNDVVFFYFSGHGSRVTAPAEFEEYEPDGKHEALVCHDSRTEEGWDLADKELAVLFSEIAKSQPHIVGILDCCHSGSGMRDVYDSSHSASNRRAKFIEEKSDIRPLKSYLDGYFVKNGCRVPKSRMALIAACDKTERAWEESGQGIFTSNLVKILKKSGSSITYSELFFLIRAKVYNYYGNQTPQLECLERFNAFSGFLDGKPLPDTHRYKVFYKEKLWRINCGAVHGIPYDTLNEVRFVIYDRAEKSAGETEVYARAKRVDMRESILELVADYPLDITKEYQGNLITFSRPSLNVCVNGEKEGTELIEKILGQEESLISFVDQTVSALYEVRCTEECYHIYDRGTGRIFSKLEGYTDENAVQVLSGLHRIERWERTLKLQNNRAKWSRLDPKDVEFIFYQIKENGEEIRYVSDDIVLDYGDYLEEVDGIPYMLKVNNTADRRLFFTLLYLSPRFGIYSLTPCESLPPNDKEMILDDAHALNMPDNTYNEVIDTFLLIVSTEKLDEFLFEQEEIGEDQSFKNLVNRKKNQSGWFTKSITVKTVRNTVL